MQIFLRLNRNFPIASSDNLLIGIKRMLKSNWLNDSHSAQCRDIYLMEIFLPESPLDAKEISLLAQLNWLKTNKNLNRQNTLTCCKILSIKASAILFGCFCFCATIFLCCSSEKSFKSNCDIFILSSPSSLLDIKLNESFIWPKTIQSLKNLHLSFRFLWIRKAYYLGFD